MNYFYFFLWCIFYVRKCNQTVRYYQGKSGWKICLKIYSRDCSRCIHWWYNCGFYNKCIFHYIRIYQSTLFTTRVPRDIWCCVRWNRREIFLVKQMFVMTRTSSYNKPCILWNKLTNEMELYLNIRNMMFIIIYLFL